LPSDQKANPFDEYKPSRNDSSSNLIKTTDRGIIDDMNSIADSSFEPLSLMKDEEGKNDTAILADILNDKEDGERG
jgi:hypothetical protein